MGLDMYASTVTEKPASEVDFEVKACEPLHYWRKHPNLHGWMARLYEAKGGQDEDFNCVNLHLTAHDLGALEAAIKADGLPFTTGFFFGESEGSEYADDLAFIARAREAIAAGRFVVYSAWW
jgi:hypothetical protein